MSGLIVPVVMLGLGLLGTGGSSVTANNAALGLRFGNGTVFLCSVLDQID